MNTKTYDLTRGWLAFLHDAYWGGDRWKMPSSTTIGTAVLYTYTINTSADGRETIMERQIKKLRTYLTPHANEGEAAFSQRASLAVYVNMIAPIVDTYAGAVTAHVDRDLGPIGDYLLNVDRQGGGWADHIEEVARWAATYGMVAVLIDAPRSAAAQNRAEEKARGDGLRACIIPPTAWAWITVDREGCLEEFAYVDAPYQTPDALQVTVTLWKWTRTTWEQHQLTLDCTASLPMESLRGAHGPDTRKDGGTLAPELGGRIPIEFAYYRRDGASRWPSGVSLVGDAADVCRQVFNILSSAEEQIRKTSFAFLSVPTKDAGGSMDPQTRIQVGPDTALPYPSDTGAPSWVQPRAETTQEIRAHAVFLLALALRLAGLEATATDSGAPDSGIALRIRSRGFESRAAAFAKGMARYERCALELAGLYLKMDGGAAVVQYPKRFTLPDESEDLDRAITLLEKLGSKLGPEGTLYAIKQAVSAALSLSDEDLGEVMDEVEAKLLVKPSAPVAPKPLPTMPEANDAAPAEAAPAETSAQEAADA